jgi:hypothetical protein
VRSQPCCREASSERAAGRAIDACGPQGIECELQAILVTKSRADFKCNTSNATKPESTCASWREVYYSTAHERTAIIYPDDNRAAVFDVGYANLCSERESSMCGC